MKKFTWLAIIALTFLSVLGGFSGEALGKSTFTIPNYLTPLEPTEKYVLERVAKGEEADLQKRFGESEEQRFLRAEFLMTLLTGEFENLKISKGEIKIVNAVITGPLNLQNAEIPYSFSLRRCIFKNEVNLINSILKRPCSFDESTFKSKANFNRFKTESHVNYNRVVFQKPVSFALGYVAGLLKADEAEFMDTANFNDAKVVGSVYLNRSLFFMEVDFRNAVIGGTLDCHESIFLNNEKIVNFSNIKVGQNVYLMGAKFHGPVSFTKADIGRFFVADEVQFINTKPADFTGMRIGDSASFRETLFKGNAEFNRVKLAEDFIGDGAQFQSMGFIDGTVGQQIRMSGVNFEGDLNLSRVQVNRLWLRGTRATSLVLNDALVKDTLVLEGSELKNFQARRLKVERSALFEDVLIKNEADLRQSNLAWLRIFNVTWPNDQKKFKLEGLAFQDFGAGDEAAGGESVDWISALTLLEKSRFNLENYRTFEQFFLRVGHRDRADVVYISGKRRENWGKDWFKPETLSTIVFVDMMTGYGRKPGRVFLFWLNWILIGMFFFDPKFIENGSWVTRAKGVHPVIMRFWLSLDRFIPGIDLGLAKNWNPRNQVVTPIWTLWYMHKLLGWGLIPIAFAYINSIMK